MLQKVTNSKFSSKGAANPQTRTSLGKRLIPYHRQIHNYDGISIRSPVIYWRSSDSTPITVQYLSAMQLHDHLRNIGPFAFSYKQYPPNCTTCASLIIIPFTVPPLVARPSGFSPNSNKVSLTVNAEYPTHDSSSNSGKQLPD